MIRQPLVEPLTGIMRHSCSGLIGRITGSVQAMIAWQDFETTLRVDSSGR